MADSGQDQGQAPAERKEQQAPPAEEWGQRHRDANLIASGGKDTGEQQEPKRE
jgi:hypothetical protein